MKFAIILIIAFVQGIILFIPQDKTFDDQLGFPNNITKHGKRLIICVVITIISTVALFFISEQESIGFDKKLKSRDSITELNRRADAKSYERKLGDANAENRKVLLDYGLEMDEKNVKLQKAVEKSKDTTFRGISPFLNLYKIKLTDSLSENKYTIKYTFSVSGATCYNIKVKMDILISNREDEISYLKKGFIPITNHQNLEKGKGYSAYLDLPKKDNVIKFYFFHVYGTYERQDKKRFKINQFYTLDLNSKSERFGTPLEFTNNRLIEFTKK
jgi:hypothetical protein